MRAKLGSLAVLLLGTLCGCSLFFFSTVYSSRSPDGKVVLRVEERCGLPDCAVRVVVSRGWPTEEIIAGGNDCVIRFAHAAWSGTRVAVFVDGSYCQTIKVAYDTASNRQFTFQHAEPWLREAIIGEYAVTPEELKGNGGDVLAWATYPGDGRPRRSSDEFRRRFRRR